MCLLGLLGLRVFEAAPPTSPTSVRSTATVPLPPAVARAVDRATGERAAGPLLLNTQGRRMDRHAATRRLRRVASGAGIRVARMHPHMLRHTYVTTMLDAGVDLRAVHIAARN